MDPSNVCKTVSQLGAKILFEFLWRAAMSSIELALTQCPGTPPKVYIVLLCLGKLLARGFPAPELLIPMVGDAGSLARPAHVGRGGVLRRACSAREGVRLWREIHAREIRAACRHS